jgi:hypothetical protein
MSSLFASSSLERPIMKPSRALLLAALASTVACGESGAPSFSDNGSPTAGGFTSLPIGFSYVQSTFGDSTAGDTADWVPGDSGGPGRHGRGHDQDGRSGGMMCGGMGGFIGSGVGLGLGVGRGEGNGALPTDCTYDGASGRVECPPEERDGLSVIKSAAYTDAAGAAQQVFDSATTNTVNLRLEVSGTRLRRDGDTSTVQHASDRTVSGLAKGSERTIQGTSAGIETTTGTDSSGAFTAVRVIGDTIAGVVLPADSSGRPTYPPAGTIRRGMQVTVTYAGQVPSSSTRQEVVTFDGSSTASVVITQDGETRTCSQPLPRGPLACS